FFFSSRRRHTRFSRDWSSDVCSSDLIAEVAEDIAHTGAYRLRREVAVGIGHRLQQRAVDGFVEGEHAAVIAFPGISGARGLYGEIGRASCREREWVQGGAGGFTRKPS